MIRTLALSLVAQKEAIWFLYPQIASDPRDAGQSKRAERGASA